MYRFIINKRHNDLLISIANSKKNSMTDMGKEIGFSYQHISIVMKQWERDGLIIKAQVEERKVQVSVEITDKGKSIVEFLRQIQNISEKGGKNEIKK